MIIDSHGHVGLTLANSQRLGLEWALDAERTVARLDRAGIDKAIIFAPIYSGGPTIDPDYHLANYTIAEACAEAPDRFIGYGRVNPNRLSAAVAEFEHCLSDYGLTGLMLHPEWDSFKPTSKRHMWPLAEICAEKSLPISFHTGYYPTCQPMLFVPLAEAFPNVPIYLKHIGYEYWRDAIVVAKRYPNIYLETAGNTTTGVIAAAIREAGADKVCYGSDFPYFAPEIIMAKVQALNLPEDEYKLVMGENSAKINNLEVSEAVAA